MNVCLFLPTVRREMRGVSDKVKNKYINRVSKMIKGSIFIKYSFNIKEILLQSY